MADDQSPKTTFTPIVVIFFLLLAALALVQGMTDIWFAESGDAVRRWAVIIAGATLGTISSIILYRKLQQASHALEDHTIRGKAAEERLGILAQALRSISETVNITDTRERFIFVNQAFEELYGYTSEELIGKSIDIVRSSKATEEVTRVIAPSSMKGEWHGELWNRRKDGTEFLISLSSTAVRDEQGRVIAMVGTASDITERNREELRLRRIELALERSSEAILMTDVGGRIDFVNPAFEQLYGYSAAEVIGKNPRVINSGKMTPEFYSTFWNHVTDKKVFSGEWLNRTKQGTIITVEASINPILNASEAIIGYLGIQRDISERKRTAQQLQASLIEKETLLHEIYHRVKNNLNIVASMVGLQASSMLDKERARPFEETRERILAMARMHDALFKAGDARSVDVNDFIRQLTVQLSRAYERSDILFDQNIENVPLDADAAIPCGMIINELISNALKHAFPNGRKGTVTIRLKQVSLNDAELTIADNGCGFDKERTAANPDSLGMTIIGALTEQLKGEMTMTVAGGTTVALRFPLRRPDSLS